MGLNLEIIQTILSELLLEYRSDMVIVQGCKDQGVVKRTTLDLNLCSNLECKSCRQFDGILKQTIKLKHMTNKDIKKMKKELTKWEQEEQKQFEEYCAKVDSTMWKGLIIFLIIIGVALLILGIVSK